MRNLNQKGIAHLFVVLLLLAGLAVGVFLIQKPTNLEPKAASKSKQNSMPGGKLNLSVPSQTIATGCNLSFDINYDTGGLYARRIDVYLKWDPEVFEHNFISTGSEIFKTLSYSVSGGVLFLPVHPTASAVHVTGTGRLAAVNLKIKKTPKTKKSFIEVYSNPTLEPNGDSGPILDSSIIDEVTGKDLLTSVSGVDIKFGKGKCSNNLPAPIYVIDIPTVVMESKRTTAKVMAKTNICPVQVSAYLIKETELDYSIHPAQLECKNNTTIVTLDNLDSKAVYSAKLIFKDANGFSVDSVFALREFED